MPSPTLITGYYGMNVPYPGNDQAWGAWAATALAILLSGTLYVTFKRKDWEVPETISREAPYGTLTARVAMGGEKRKYVAA